LREDVSGISTIRRKRRKHPSRIRTSTGIEEIIPGLSTWTAEDLVEAGAWDEELAKYTDFYEEYEIVTPEEDE
jgi:hypothetical protein